MGSSSDSEIPFCLKRSRTISIFSDSKVFDLEAVDIISPLANFSQPIFTDLTKLAISGTN